MQTQILQYRIIITPDTQTGTNQAVYTASCPLLGIADDGTTIEEALQNIKGAIEAYVESLAEDGEIIPIDHPENDIVTTTHVQAPSSLPSLQQHI